MLTIVKKLSIVSIIAIVMISCANNPVRSYKMDSDKMLTTIYQEEESVPINLDLQGSKNDLLFYMENGTYLRLISQYKDSDKQLQLAQNIIEIWMNSWKNSTIGTTSRIASEMLLNDNISDYNAKGYEKTMLSTYRALNHIALNDWSEARIEIKKMYEIEEAIFNYNEAMYLQTQANTQQLQQNSRTNQLYQELIDKYDLSSLNTSQVLALKNSYQSAFGHYLAGFIFEALSEPSLSRPGYLKALQLNPQNKLTQRSIDNLDKYKTQKSGFTNLLIIEEVGHAPQFRSKQINLPFNYNINNKQQACINSINLFFPELVIDVKNQQSYGYFIDNIRQQQELYTDYSLMAARYLHDEMPHLIERNISAALRNIATSQASCASGGNIGTILSIVTTISGIMLDRADERTWVLLPNKVYLNRVQLPYGQHIVQVVVDGKTYSKNITLDTAYQIISFRVIGGKVLFNVPI